MTQDGLVVPAPAGLPTSSSAATGRNLAALFLRTWRVTVTAAHLVPLEGPVLLVANHTAFLDGMVLAGTSPRPVNVLATSELFTGPLARVLRGTGQVEVASDGPGRTAMHTARDLLRDGRAVGVFPEAQRGAGDVQHVRHGAAYLAAHTDAIVIPVAILGTRPAGAGKDALPRVRARIEVLFGDPVDVRVQGDPRRRAVLARSGERIRQALADHVRMAVRRTGLELPGPLATSSTTPEPRSAP